MGLFTWREAHQVIHGMRARVLPIITQLPYQWSVCYIHMNLKVEICIIY